MLCEISMRKRSREETCESSNDQPAPKRMSGASQSPSSLAVEPESPRFMVHESQSSNSVPSRDEARVTSSTYEFSERLGLLADLRWVYPYCMDHVVHAKKRWLNRPLLDVFTEEFTWFDENYMVCTLILLRLPYSPAPNCSRGTLCTIILP